jgi:hypothetical protein
VLVLKLVHQLVMKSAVSRTQQGTGETKKRPRHLKNGLDQQLVLLLCVLNRQNPRMTKNKIFDQPGKRKQSGATKQQLSGPLKHRSRKLGEVAKAMMEEAMVANHQRLVIVNQSQSHEQRRSRRERERWQDVRRGEKANNQRNRPADHQLKTETHIGYWA